jgi:hypothetical protein
MEFSNVYFLPYISRAIVQKERNTKACMTHTEVDNFRRIYPLTSCPYNIIAVLESKNEALRAFTNHVAEFFPPEKFWQPSAHHFLIKTSPTSHISPYYKGPNLLENMICTHGNVSVLTTEHISFGLSTSLLQQWHGNHNLFMNTVYFLVQTITFISSEVLDSILYDPVIYFHHFAYFLFALQTFFELACTNSENEVPVFPICNSIKNPVFPNWKKMRPQFPAMFL